MFTDTGRTFREVFREADDAFKERAIGWHGHFVVTPAKRGTPVEERLKWDGYTPPPADVQREVAETALERIGRARANRQN